MDAGQDIEALASVADAIAGRSTWLWTVGHELAKHLTLDDRSMTDAEVAVVRAFQITIDSSNGDGPVCKGWWLDGETKPGEEVGWLDAWSAAADAVAHPALCAHLCDLLWIERHGDSPHQYARRAIDSYLDEWGPNWERFDRAVALLRAFDLAKQLRDPSARERAEGTVLDATREALRDGDHGTAVAYLTHAPASAWTAKSQPLVADLIAESIEIVTSAEHVERLVKAVLTAATNGTVRLGLTTRAVDAFRSEAAATEEPFLRLHRLREAARIAEELGHPAHAEIIHEIEATDASAGFRRLRHDFTLPRSAVSDFIESVVGADDLGTALRRYASHLPISPESLDNDRSKMKVGIRHAVTSQRIGEANSVVTSTETSAAEDASDHIAAAFERDVLNMAGYMAQFSAFTFLAPALHQILDSYRPWTTEEVAADLRSGWIDASCADALARALDHFAHARYDEAALVALPRIERMVRQIARNTGVPTTKRPTPRVGGIRGMGEILSDLRGAEGAEPLLPEPHLTSTDLLLINAECLNLRNDLLHGIREEADAPAAALILQVGLALALGLELHQTVEPSDSPAEG